jgi:hypothetical protein
MLDLTNKTCAILAHGNSLYELESRIKEFRNKDVVWCGMNYFAPSEEILKKINKSFSIIYDSSTIANDKALKYENNIRIPNLSKFLDRDKNNKYICSNSDNNNLYNLRERHFPEFNKKYKNQIICVEDLGINPKIFFVSLPLYIASLIKMGCKKIIMFGADGGGKYGNNIESYYNHKLVKAEKDVAGILNYNISGDTSTVNTQFESIMIKTFGYIPTEIFNCSINSAYTIFKKITYNEILNYLNNN